MNRQEEIKNRISLINMDKIPDGYKRIHSKILPKEWKEEPLNSLCIKRTEKVGNKKLETLSITAGIGFVNQAEKFGRELSGEQYKNYTVIRKGDFSYNKGNSQRYPQGCIYVLDNREIAAVPSVYITFAMNNNCDTDYYRHLFQAGYLNRYLHMCINYGVRNDGLLNLYDNDFYSSMLPLPSLKEQTRIAKILNCCDKVLELKQKILDEKRKNKCFLSCKLLTPRKNWIKKAVGTFGKVLTGNTPSTNTAEYYGTDIPWITPSDITSQKDIYTGERSLSSLGAKKTRLLPKNSVLITCIASIGKNAVLRCTGSCNQQINAIIPNESMDSDFIYYLFEQNLFLLKKYAGTSATSIINKDTFENLIFKVPNKKEQTQIAEVLSQIDKEIELLEQELEAYKRLKKALSQLLLTGIVRVV